MKPWGMITYVLIVCICRCGFIRRATGAAHICALMLNATAILPRFLFPAMYESVLEEVRDTYHDVRRLEASIIELHKMFMDLALLVDRQGEMLDQIEYQVRGCHRRGVRFE